jgi:hypothetical protein
VAAGGMPAQSLPPFIIITVGVAGMGALQYGVGLIFKPTKVSSTTPTTIVVDQHSKKL